MDVEVVGVVGSTHELGVTKVFGEESLHFRELSLVVFVLLLVLPSSHPHLPKFGVELIKSLDLNLSLSGFHASSGITWFGSLMWPQRKTLSLWCVV